MKAKCSSSTIGYLRETRRDLKAQILPCQLPPPCVHMPKETCSTHSVASPHVPHSLRETTSVRQERRLAPPSAHRTAAVHPKVFAYLFRTMAMVRWGVVRQGRHVVV